MYIQIYSDLHKAFHEAGHIEAAYIWGGSVSGAHFNSNGSTYASVKHTEDRTTKKPVACGGFAAEWLLYDLGWLRTQDGSALSESAFLRQAMESARLDKRGFYLTKPMNAQGEWPDSPYQPTRDWRWPPDSDEPFIFYAKNSVVPRLGKRLKVMECVARQLEEKRELSQEEIEEIRNS